MKRFAISIVGVKKVNETKSSLRLGFHHELVEVSATTYKEALAAVKEDFNKSNPDACINSIQGLELNTQITIKNN